MHLNFNGNLRLQYILVVSKTSTNVEEKKYIVTILGDLSLNYYQGNFCKLGRLFDMHVCKGRPTLLEHFTNSSIRPEMIFPPIVGVNFATFEWSYYLRSENVELCVNLQV